VPDDRGTQRNNRRVLDLITPTAVIESTATPSSFPTDQRSVGWAALRVRSGSRRRCFCRALQQWRQCWQAARGGHQLMVGRKAAPFGMELICLRRSRSMPGAAYAPPGTNPWLGSPWRLQAGFPPLHLAPEPTLPAAASAAPCWRRWTAWPGAGA